MRVLLLTGWLLIALATRGMAVLLPMSAKDLALMVRMEVPEADILAELEKRRLAAPLDGAAESTLTASGTSAALIEKIKRGNYALNAGQAAVLAEQAIRQAALQKTAAVPSRGTAPLAPVNPGGASAPMLGRLEEKLVRLSGAELRGFNAGELNSVRYFVIYNSAHWCGPCRSFTPKLVEFYRRMKPTHPEFEIIFASSDRDEASMVEYMRGAEMTWPALRFDARKMLSQYTGNGIPWLVIVDQLGRPLTQNAIDKQFIAPTEILAQLEAQLK